MSRSPVLRVEDVSKIFGGLNALEHVDLTIWEGEIVALIGPNGAGKTTLFNCVTGLYDPTEGQILLVHEESETRIDNKPPDAITRLGVGRTFQNLRLFANMTAIENVMVGRHARTREGIFSAVVRPPSFARAERETAEHARRLLAFVGLAAAHQNELAKNLAYGDMRRLEIARALATEPFLLLLDEPTAGMNPVEKRQLASLVQQIRRTGVTILVIEHDMRFVMGISERIAVLDHGVKIAEGTPAEIQRDERVIEAYLGRAAG